MKLFISSLLLITIYHSNLNGQQYFQQEVNYEISAKLNDEKHELRCFEKINYINNSPDTLEYIYFHLWPNAYNGESSALAKQLLAFQNKDITKYPKSKLGWIDSLDFKSKEKALNWKYDEHHKDIAKVYLDIPLNPGDSVDISTPFLVKLPSAEISRLGHIGQSYQITQWYPKPAVYDKNGWHQMPYLNQGEFYAEFGSFDVSIELPENYIVGATGDLQNKAEIERLNKLADVTKKMFEEGQSFHEIENEIPSSKQYKKLNYKQTNVHDFAWFADKTFLVSKGTAELPLTNKKIDLWTMFTPKNAILWKDAINYLHDAAYYYSLWNGDYPYQQITAIDGTIAAGGGMEYPNVTIIGNMDDTTSLEIVIVHEVGHNWFYGILGTNERIHGWMDEGLNTFNEVRYFQTKYPNNNYMSESFFDGSFNFHGLNYQKNNEFSYRTLASLGLDQPIATKSEDFMPVNYGLVMYAKTGLVFDYLFAYLGQEKFDEIMRDYYQKWKFKHPQPEDLKAVFETHTSESLDWFFEDLIKTTKKIDYKLSCVHHKHGKSKVKIKNSGQIEGPVHVTVSNETNKEDFWIKPNQKKTNIEIDFIAESVIIDKNEVIPESNRQNNTWEKQQIFNKIEPIKTNFAFSYNRKSETNINYLPMFGLNKGDGLMIGTAIHNISPAMNPLQYIALPMFGFSSNTITGIGDASYLFFPKKHFSTLRIGIRALRFSSDNQGRNSYNTISPYLVMYSKSDNHPKKWSKKLELRSLLQQEFSHEQTHNDAGGFAQITFKNKHPKLQVDVKARQSYLNDLKNGDNFSRFRTSTNVNYKYNQSKNKSIQLRAFMGYTTHSDISSNSNNHERYAMNLIGQNGMQDIFKEEFFLSRYASSGLLAQQRRENLGGFLLNENSKETNEWMMTTRIYADLPIPLFGVYAETGAVSMQNNIYGVYNLGAGIKIRNFIGVYYSLISNIADIKNFEESFRITLNLNFIGSDQIKNLMRYF